MASPPAWRRKVGPSSARTPILRRRLGLAHEFGKAAGSSREAAAGADAVILVVVNAAQCEAVLFGDAGVLASTAPDALIISCVTMAPAQAHSIGEKVEATGRAFVDAPTSGGPARAAEGALTLLTSGRETR